MTDILQVLDDELFRTPHDAHICRPLRRSVVAAAAAEIRRLRVALSQANADAARERARREYDSADAYNARINAALRGDNHE